MMPGWDAFKILFLKCCGFATETDAKAFALSATTVTTSDGGVMTTTSTLHITTDDVESTSAFASLYQQCQAGHQIVETQVIQQANVTPSFLSRP